METKANYVLVGVFTVVVLILSFGFVYWSANVSDQDSQVQMLVRIEGSVTGLSVGSQVLFNGLRVGDVRNLKIDPNDPRTVIATTKIEATTPITTSTRATIGFAGLTGQAFIELKGGDVTERNIIDYAREQGAVPVIKADPSDVTDILATAKDISERANNILTQFESIVGDVSPAVKTTASNISETSENIRVFTGSLANNSGEIDNFLASVSRLANTANTVAEALPNAIRSVQGVVEAVDPKAVSATVNNIAAASQTLRDQSMNIASVVDSVKTAAGSIGAVGDTLSRNTPGIDRFLSNLGPISETAGRVATKLDNSLGSAENILAAIQPADVTQTLKDISSAARNVTDVSNIIGAKGEEIASVIADASDITRNVKGLTDTFNGNRQAIDRFVASLGPIGDNASQASARLNTLADNASQLISSIDRNRISGAIDSISGAATNVADLAKSIGSQSEAINQTISDVSGISRNLNSVSETFAANKEAIDRFVTNLGPIGDNAASASAGLNAAVQDARQLVASIDQRRVSETVDHVANIAGALDAKAAKVQSIIDGVDKAVRTVDATVAGFNGTRQQVDRILSGVDPATINRAVANVSSATDNVARAADSIASISNDIGRRRDDINTIITNIQETSGKVNTASSRLDKLLASADTLLNSSSTEGLVAEASATLKTIREAAANIQAQIGPIAANIQRFSGGGLTEVRTLVRDVTRSVNRIEGAVTDFQSNPSRILFGGDEVKQFNGRSRR